MAAKLRVYQEGIQVLAKGETKLRLYQMGIQVLWVDAVYWGGDVSAESTLEATLTVLPPELTIFDFMPYYPVEEILEWKTDIIRANKGSEQRMALRSAPRQSFNYNCLLASEAQQARFDSKLFTWQKSFWYMPIWTERTLITADISITDTTITFDTTTGDYRDGGWAMLWKDSDNYEILYIDTVAAGQLNLDSGVGATYTGNKFVMPVRLAQVQGAVKGTNPKVASVRDTGIVFAVKNNIEITGYTAAETYNDIPVLADEHRFTKTTKEVSSDGDCSSEDYSTGRFNYFSDSEFNVMATEYGWLLESMSDIWAFRQFLHYLKGRRGLVWIPTFRADIVQQATIGAADTSFDINNVGLANDMGVNDLRTYIAFIFPDGSRIYRKITNIVNIDSSTDTLTIDYPPAQEIEVGDCYISFLDLYRPASDTVRLSWLLPNLMQCNMNFIAVEE